MINVSKALITATVVFAALTSNGAGSTAGAYRSQDFRPAVVVSSNPECAGSVDSDQDQLREEFHQTYPLSPTGRVTLENINGGVEIKVWDRPAIQVDAIKRAYRRERLAEARIEINAAEENIRIKTEYPDEHQNFRNDERRYENPAIVDYTLTVPRRAILESIELINGSINIDGVEGNVKASSINGRVTARGLQGETKLSTINGPLQATFTSLDESKPIFLTSVNGSVTVVIPSDANASIRADTVHGGIANDFGLTVRHGEYVGHDLNGQIGTGGPRIRLSNVNGSVRILHQQDGRPLSPGRSAVEVSQISEESKRALREELAREAAREVEATNAAVAEEVKRASREAAREAREATRELQRRDVVLREAQREVARAQAEIQRAVQRQTREDMRATGRGVGSGSGIGYGGGRFTAQESKSFGVSGSPRVNIGTFDGAVVVHGWDKPEVMYTVTKRADDEAYLKQIVVDANQDGDGVSIIARSEEQNGTAQIEVYVPRKSSLHVSSDDGRLNLEGVSGEITMRTGDGAIDVSNAGGRLMANTGDGHISVGNFEGQVDARTGDGSISLDGNFSGVGARTGDGSITLVVPAGSNFTVETNASNTITNEGVLLTEDVTPTQRVRRWRIGSGGKLFVLKTGDGRIVVRSR